MQIRNFNINLYALSPILISLSLFSQNALAHISISGELNALCKQGDCVCLKNETGCNEHGCIELYGKYNGKQKTTVHWVGNDVYAFWQYEPGATMEVTYCTTTAAGCNPDWSDPAQRVLDKNEVFAVSGKPRSTHHHFHDNFCSTLFN